MAADLRIEQMPPNLLAPSTSFVSASSNPSRLSSSESESAPSTEETMKTVEACLKKRIRADDCVAFFQLGQLYFEQVKS